MFVALALAVVLSVAHYVTASGVPWYGQCGGKGYDGNTHCISGAKCEVINEYYSQCVPDPNHLPERPRPYEQCGGKHYTGSVFCVGDSQCIWLNPFYSQCLPEGQLADLGDPCGPATPGNKHCALQTQKSGPTFMKCSSDTDEDAKCVMCGFLGLACCPAGLYRPDRPPCQMAPRATVEIPCVVEEDVCEGDPIQ